MKYNIGDRILAISHGKDGELFVFGEGEYVGEEVPDSHVGGFMGQALRDGKIPNPCIRLDSGKKVYGCECWWGPVGQVKKKYAEWTFVEIDIDDKRASANAEEE